MYQGSSCLICKNVASKTGAPITYSNPQAYRKSQLSNALELYAVGDNRSSRGLRDSERLVPSKITHLTADYNRKPALRGRLKQVDRRSSLAILILRVSDGPQHQVDTMNGTSPSAMIPLTTGDELLDKHGQLACDPGLIMTIRSSESCRVLSERLLRLGAAIPQRDRGTVYEGSSTRDPGFVGCAHRLGPAFNDKF